LKLEKIDSIILNLDSKKKSGEYSNFFLDSFKAKDYSENMWSTMYLQTIRKSQEYRPIYAQRMKELEKQENEEKKQREEQQSQQNGPVGNISAWGFEGMGKLSETFSSWDTPTSFTAEGNSMYTFLGQTSGPISDMSGKSGAEATKSENTVKSKTGSNFILSP
jgi:hypothetical protein